MFMAEVYAAKDRRWPGGQKGLNGEGNAGCTRSVTPF